MYTSLPCQKAIFIRPPLFQYNGRLLGQKAGVACLYMPQDGYWLAGFEIYPPQKLALHRPKKSKFPFENCCFCYWFMLKKIRPKRRNLALLSENFNTPISTLANNKRSCSKKRGKFRPKLRFSMFQAKILSRGSRLSRTTRGPARLIRPRSIDCDSRRDRQMKNFLVCAIFCCNIAKQKKWCPLCLL